MNKIILIGVILITIATPALSDDDEKYIANIIREVKVDLARSYLAVNYKEDLNIASVTPRQIFEENVVQDNESPSSSRYVWPFNAYGKSFILSGSSVLQVSAEPNLTKQVASLTLRDSAEQIAFIKTVEWRRILFVVIAFKQGYCRLHTTSSSLDFVLRQTIHNFGQARDAEFFKYKNNLFLVLVMYKSDNSLVHSRIYRWTGTHLDETQSFTTSGAVAVRTFYDKTSVFIIVAQNLPDNPMVGSQVLRFEGSRLERVQFVATHGPLALQPYAVKGERYLLVVNDKEPSVTFWWSGTEFLPWETLPDIHGKYEISTVLTKSQNVIVYLLQNNSVTIYEPNELNFRAIQKLHVPQAEADEMVKVTQYANSHDILLFISRRNNKLYLHLLKMNFVKPAPGIKTKNSDPLLECLENLGKKLEERQEQVKYVQSMSDKLLLVDEAIKYSGKLVIGGRMEAQNISTTSVFVGGLEGHSLVAASSHLLNALQELDELIASSTDEVADILYESKPGIIYGDIVVQGDLIINIAKSDDFTAPIVNRKYFEPQFLLTYSGNETITQNTSIHTLIVHNLNTKSVSGKNLDNLLSTQGDQVLTGKFTLPEVSVQNIEIAGHTFLQLQPFSSRESAASMANMSQPKIKQIKAMNLTVENMNGVSLGDVQSNESVRSAEDDDKDDVTFDKDVTITDLYINSINGISWNDFIESLFLVNHNQSVDGDVTFNSKVDIQNFTVLMINDDLCENFMTKSTDQNIDATFEVGSIKVKHLECANINGLELSQDVVRSGVENYYISGAVTVDDLHVTGNLTVEEGVHVTGSPDPLNDNRRHYIYTGKVTINGTLKVINNIDFEESIIYIGDSIFKFSDIFNQYWTKSSEQTIVVPVEFVERLTVKGNLNAGNINGYSASDYAHFGTAELAGNLVFDAVRVGGSVRGEPGVTVSGVDLARLDHEAVRLNGRSTIDGLKEFRGGLSVNDMHCHYLNGVDTTNDIVTLESNGLQIKGTKNFDKLIINGDLTSDGPINAKIINNEAISEKLNSIVLVDEPITLQNVEFENIKAANVKSRIMNGFELDSLSKKYEQWNGSLDKVEIHGNVEFKDKLSLITVNDIHVENYFAKVLSKSEGGTVTGPLTVHGDVRVEHLHSDVVDGVDVNHLQSTALSRTREQVITGHYTIDNVWTEHMDASLISGIDMTKLIYINDMAQQVKNGNLKFHSAKFNNLVVDNLNGCNISQALESVYHVQGKRQYDSVEIAGSLDWRHSVGEHELLSYIFERGVTTHADQLITGRVTFQGRVAADTMEVKQSINNVNLDFIFADALMKYQDYQEVSCSKYFDGKLTAQKANVSGNAVIKEVNDIDVLALNQSLVRGFEENRKIRGHKHFISGFSADEFTCAGKINDISISDIVTFDSKPLPPTHFKNLEIIEDLNFQTINSINIDKFISERVTLKGNQDIDGYITFKSNLKLFGDSTVAQINDVPLSDVMHVSAGGGAEAHQRMDGYKTFLKQLVVEGALDVDVINGVNVTDIFTRALLADEDSVINGNVVFTEDVTLNSDLDVGYLMNGIHIDDLPHLVKQDAISNMPTIDSYRRDIVNSVQQSVDKLSGMAVELMYLEEEDEERLAQVAPRDVRRASAMAVGSSATLLSAFGWDAASSCGLPEGCLCPRQDLFLVNGQGASTSTRLDASQRHFFFMDTKNPVMAVKIKTNTVSLSQKCRKLASDNNDVDYEGTSLHWSIPPPEAFFTDIGIARFSVPGYLAHAKGFKIGSITYIVLALSYDNILDTHDVDSLVFKMTPRMEPKLVQKLATHGARVLEVVQQPASSVAAAAASRRPVHLVIGNTFDSSLNQSDVDLYIYSFDAKREKFFLVRAYPTSGAVAIKSVVLGAERLVLVAQRLRASLVVLKYSPLEDNYFFFQEIAMDAPVLDIGVFYVGAEDAFVGAVTENGMLQVFKYAYIEGFQLVLSQARTHAHGFTPFTVERHQYVFLPSSSSSTADTQILKIVTQGP